MKKLAMCVALIIAVGCEDEQLEWDGIEDDYVTEQSEYRKNQINGVGVTVTIKKAQHFDHGQGLYGTNINYRLAGNEKKLTLVDECHEDAMLLTGALPGTTVPAPELVNCSLTCISYNSDRECEDCDIDCSDEVTGG